MSFGSIDLGVFVIANLVNVLSRRGQRLALFAALLACGFLVFVVGGYLGTIPRDVRTGIKVAIASIWGAALAHFIADALLLVGGFATR